MSHEDVERRFEEAWKSGQFRKLEKQKARKRFERSVATDDDWKDLQAALANYNAYCMANREWYHPKMGSTFFSQWRDWFKVEEPVSSAVATIEQPPDHNPIHICRACPVEHEWSCAEYPGCAMTKYVACPEVIAKWGSNG